MGGGGEVGGRWEVGGMLGMLLAIPSLPTDFASFFTCVTSS